jgi:hypothetical protein
MKLRTLKLTPERLIQLLQGKTGALRFNLPSDTELLELKMDLFTKQVFAVVRSDCFEDVAENMPIPELTITATVGPKSATKPVAVTKIEVKQPEPAAAKPPQPQVNRYAAKMENEFSPEQRKLLSFTVKGNGVVVKPIQFLKAEWDDINEVVRSLGGKWVKGDIISYWEIPLE